MTKVQKKKIHKCNQIQSMQQHIEHSKNTGVKLDPERVHWGQNPFRVNDDPENSQLDAEYNPELGQSDPSACQICRKLTKIRVTFDPELSMTPMDPFPGHVDPGVVRVKV